MKNLFKNTLLAYGLAGLVSMASAQEQPKNDSINMDYSNISKHVQEGSEESLFKDNCYVKLLEEDFFKDVKFADHPTELSIKYDGNQVSFKGKLLSEFETPVLNNVKMYEMLDKVCPGKDNQWINLVFQGAGKNETISVKQGEISSLEKQLADERNYLGKMLFSAGAVVGVDNVLAQDGVTFAYVPHTSGFVGVSAPFWTIVDEELKRHVLMGSVEAYLGSPKLLSENNLVSSEYTNWKELAPNMHAAQKVEVRERTAVQSLASAGLTYNFAIPVRDRVHHDGEWISAKDVLNLYVGAGVNISAFGTNETTSKEDFLFSGPNENSVLLSSGQSYDPITLDAKQKLAVDGMYLRVGVPITDQIGFVGGVNHLGGKSEKTYQFGVSFTPNTFKKVEK
jgi:hypothetical protein